MRRGEDGEQYVGPAEGSINGDEEYAKEGYDLMNMEDKAAEEEDDAEDDGYGRASRRHGHSNELRRDGGVGMNKVYFMYAAQLHNFSTTILTSHHSWNRPPMKTPKPRKSPVFP